MTVIGPLVTRRRLVLVDLEADRGDPVDPPTISLIMQDAKIDNKTPYQERKPAGGFAGHSLGALGEYVGTFSGKADLMGNGNATTPALDPGLAVLLLACGMQIDGAGALTPVTSPNDQRTATIYCYQDGLVKGLSGCMGNATIEGTVGGPMTCSFEMQGVWIDVTEDELPESELPEVVAPRFAGTELTLDAYKPKFSRFSLKLGNRVVPRRDVGPIAGVLHYVVVDRDVQVTIDAEAELLTGGHDAFGLFKTGTPAIMSLTIGTEVGNKIILAAPKVQYRQVAEGDRDGIATHDLTGQCCFDDGDDEISITPVQPVP